MAQSKKRARQQATEMEVPDYIHSGGEYNIWYHKRLGDRPVRRTEPSTTRCDPEADSGRTKADSLPGRHYLCLYFARGKCVHGYKCQYYHRIPTIEDERSLPITHDVFGRERHATDRDDMGGVGNFNRNNRTLYIGGLQTARDGLEKLIHEEFGKYGEVEYVRVIRDRMIAFVRFKVRVCAEFAKEAMSDQSLSKGEVLNIRWSHEDPNPVAKRYEENELNRQAAEGIINKSKDMGVPEYMLEHKAVETKEHPYTRLESQRKKAEEPQSAAESTITSQQQNFLQWAQFFAQQGIDPSQLDEKTIQYYQQYYTNYYQSLQAPYYGQQAVTAAPGSTPAAEPASSTAQTTEATTAEAQTPAAAAAETSEPKEDAKEQE